MEPTSITVVTDREATVDGFRDGDALLFSEDALTEATGWELKPFVECLPAQGLPLLINEWEIFIQVY